LSRKGGSMSTMGLVEGGNDHRCATVGAVDGGDTLASLRARIDEIDRDLVRLLNERFAVCERIGAAKRAAGGAGDAVVYVPSREKAVLDKVSRLNRQYPGPLSEPAVRSIFREIMSYSIHLQRPISIVYPGESGGLAHQAAIARFGTSLTCVGGDLDLRAVFDAVQRGHSQYGVVPVDRLSDMISVMYRLACSDDLMVYAEIALPVALHLCTASASRPAIADIRRVFVPPESAGRCRRWLAQTMPAADVVESRTLADAMSEAAVDDGQEKVVVCTALAAMLHRFNVIADGIEDSGDAIDQFVIIGRDMDRATGADKSSIVFALSGCATSTGTLCDVLSLLKRHDVNLMSITSREVRHVAEVTRDCPGAPRLAPDDSFFFIDVDGHVSDADARIRSLINDLRQRCAWVRLLGSRSKSTSPSSFAVRE
ncbi:hypothetical protein PBRA_001378, partial [Plasmodiophora brassicae]